jgi:AraC-like DNA-binding protein
MDFICEERPTDSPFVDTIWRSQSDYEGSFISMAESQYSLVVTRYKGRNFITVRGPSTKAAPVHSPAGAEFLGIQFKPGVFILDLPVRMVMERHDLSLPEASGDSFWLKGSAWQYPDFEHTDTFVERLVRSDLLVVDPLVAAVLSGQPAEASVRTVRRRFVRSTGLTYGSLFQIERARAAAALLKGGASILDTVSGAGYFDQPHLTRSLKRFIGLTPAQITDRGRSTPLSFLYKKNPILPGYNDPKEYGPHLKLASSLARGALSR